MHKEYLEQALQKMQEYLFYCIKNRRVIEGVAPKRDPIRRDGLEAKDSLVKRKTNDLLTLNELDKSFRPFAPSVLKDDLSKWFDLDVDSPYMLLVANINESKKIEMTNDQKKLFGIEKLNIKRSEIPAVTHVDYSSRIQTVNKKTNPRYYDLISKFKEKTGCPVIVNTSFNVRGEPIVNSPKDAYNCFMGTELDYLIIGNCILDKNKQDTNLKKDYKEKFELD